MINEFIEQNKEELYRVHRELCLIPAPSHHEEKRAEYCKAYLESIGATGVYIDQALNVVFPYHCEGSDRITVINAHTDTVFPFDTPLNFIDDGETIRCPGAGDDTGNLAVMLLGIKYLLQTSFVPEGGILFVCNSCEEGLGNLKGIRRIFKDYEGRIRRMLALDGSIETLYPNCVGSHRYEVTVKTEGGHSYAAFGNQNAIVEAAKIINAISELKYPFLGKRQTTYNVGTVRGGTSVNTIAQEATFLCEYRSDHAEHLQIMKEQFERIFRESQKEGVSVSVTLVGDRPCGIDVPQDEMDRMISVCREIHDRLLPDPIRLVPASTDCNIPLSLGIPAICVGVLAAYGGHTKEEWVDKRSMLVGLSMLVQVIAAFY